MTGVRCHYKKKRRDTYGEKTQQRWEEDQADMGRGRRELPESLQREPCPATRLWSLTPWFLTPGL